MGDAAAGAVGIVFVTLLAGGPAFGQHVPETVPRAGEQRLNRYQFYGSHNAFQRDPSSLREQVDDWGHSFLELDVWYNGTSFEVQHNCCDTTGESTLDAELEDLKTSQRVQSGLVVVDFQLHRAGDGACSYCFEPFPADFRKRFQEAFESRFPGAIYTSDEFEKVDSHRWPSPQELLRRGKHVIITGAFGVSQLFFDYGDWPTVGNSNTVLWSSGYYDLTCNDGASPMSVCIGDRWLFEWYPEALITTCTGDTDFTSTWLSAVASGYTFPTMYCLTDTDLITDSRMHPPLPTYVNATTQKSEQLGTWGRPFAGQGGLVNAVLRINGHQQQKGPSNITIVLEGGVSYSTSNVLANAPPFVTLTTRGAPAKLVP